MLTKKNVRSEVRDILAKPQRPFASVEQKSDKKALKLLQEKDCYHLKADKGNSVIILDKSDYVSCVDNLIQNGSYTQLKRSPLFRMKTKVESCLKK